MRKSQDIFAASQSITITNVVDLRKEKTTEVVMRVHTGIFNDQNLFYTDDNGVQVCWFTQHIKRSKHFTLQFLKRKYFEKQGITANYYPMASSIFTESSEYRVTISGDHPHGATMIQPGDSSWI